MRHVLISLLLAALAGCAAAPVARVEPLRAAQYNEAGMQLSAQGRHGEAIEQFQAAIALEPGRAYLHNNLGYAQLLRGDPVKALQAFQAALHLDPAHPAARRNLRDAQARMSPPRAAPAPAAPVREPAPARPEPGPAVSISPVSPHVFELRSPARFAPAPAPAQRVAPRKPRLDVANGNGVPGMARRMAQRLARHGVVIARVSNELPFNRPATVVQYRAGHEAQALELAARLPFARTALNDALPGGIDLRLVLGRDTPTLAALAG